MLLVQCTFCHLHHDTFVIFSVHFGCVQRPISFYICSTCRWCHYRNMHKTTETFVSNYFIVSKKWEHNSCGGDLGAWPLQHFGRGAIAPMESAPMVWYGSYSCCLCSCLSPPVIFCWYFSGSFFTYLSADFGSFPACINVWMRVARETCVMCCFSQDIIWHFYWR